MKYLIYILLFVGVLFGQTEEKTITLPESDVIEWANKLIQFEKSDSLQSILILDLELIVKKLESNAIIDSLIISNKTQQVELLQETNEIYKEKVKLVTPKWYENKWLWFTYGVVATSISVWLTGQLVGN